MNELILRTRAFGAGALRRMKDFWEDEDGMGTVEVILIIVEKRVTGNTYVLCGN